jgi:hypothetical protein
MPAPYGHRFRAPNEGRAPMSATRRMLQTRVNYQQHDKAHQAAEALGISVSALLAELVDRMRVDANGRPAWEKSRYARLRAPVAAPETDVDADPMRLSA